MITVTIDDGERTVVEHVDYDREDLIERGFRRLVFAQNVNTVLKRYLAPIREEQSIREKRKQREDQGTT